MTWTTTELLASLRRRGRLPDSQPTDAELLLDADHAMRSTCLTLLRTLQEGYGLVTEDTSIVANQATYELPGRAFGTTLDDLLYVDTDGTEVSLPMIDHSDLHRHRIRSPYWRTPYAFSIRGGKVVLAPTPEASSGTLRFVYQERPGVLVAASRGAQVTATTATTWTVDGTGAFGGSGTVTVDVRGKSSPFSPRFFGDAATWDGTDTFTEGTAGNAALVSVGDWVTLENETVIVPVPDLMHSLLVAATLVHTHQAFGHTEEMQVMQAVHDRELAGCRQALEPRVTGEAAPVLNPHSPLRGRSWRQGNL